MAFDKQLLKDIKAHVDIVDVISCYLNVIKKGRNFAAVCPFHDDHDPSLHISKERQTYHCFVCQSGGDAFTFVEKYEKISFEDAVRKVAQIANFDDPRLHAKSVVKKTDDDLVVLYNCINELQKYYEYGMMTDEGLVARNYLNERKLSDEQKQKFSLGYAMNDGKMTIEYLKKKGFSLKNIEDIGIALARSSGTSDSNAGRLVFPIKNSDGQVVGFSARKMKSGGDDPKYVNSPETKLFHKGDILYNLHNAKQSCRHDGYIYLVEGFMDVFALDSIGITSVVALMGTAMTKTQANILRRLNVEVRLCLDGDNAGQKAMMKIVPLLDEANVAYRFVSVPNEVRDPDEILKEDGPEKLKVYLNTLVDHFDFALNYYQNIAPLGSIDDRKKVIKHFLPVLTNVKDKLEYEDYLYKLARATNFDVAALKKYVEEAKFANEQKESTESYIYVNKKDTQVKMNVKKELRRLLLAEQSVLEQMIVNKDAVTYYEENIKYFYDEVNRSVANYLVEYLSKNDTISISDIIDEISMSESSLKSEVISKISSLSMSESRPPYSLMMMNECKKIIDEERNKIFERNLFSKAMEGKTSEEKARILNDYLKRIKNSHD